MFDDFEIISIAHYGPEGPGPEGTIMSARFRLAGGEFRCADSPVGHAWNFTPAISLWIECENAEEQTRIFDRLAAGGQVFMPLDDYGFSTRFGLGRRLAWRDVATQPAVAANRARSAPDRRMSAPLLTTVRSTLEPVGGAGVVDSTAEDQAICGSAEERPNYDDRGRRLCASCTGRDGLWGFRRGAFRRRRTGIGPMPLRGATGDRQRCDLVPGRRAARPKSLH